MSKKGEKNPPMASTGIHPSDRRDPWKKLREKPGVKIHDTARKSLRDR